MPRWTLGLGGSDHDFSAALMRDADIRVAIEQERLSRRKHGLSEWFSDPLKLAIDYCLDAESIAMVNIETIVASNTLPSRVRHGLREFDLRLYPHHLCHAASAYLMLPIGTNAGVLVYDGFGSIRESTSNESFCSERETFSFYVFRPSGISCIGQTFGLSFDEQDGFPIGVTDSVGMLYEIANAVLGFDPVDSGKTMGLSSHGIPRYVPELEEFITYGSSASTCFRCTTDRPALAAALEKILLEGRGSFSARADLAATVQTIVNKTLVNCARLFVGQDIDFLCLSGGCALNTVATSFLIENSPLDVPVISTPFCGDAGLGLGALWLDRYEHDKSAPELTFRGAPVSPAIARPGRSYTRSEVHLAAQAHYPRLIADPSVSSARDVARIIADGAIIGVVNGGSEIGPRALGGRSIFADPRSAWTREKINRHIKRREPFRPLSPIIRQSEYEDYFFDDRQVDPFMLKISRARERCVREAPAVVHVDGTSRVQVVPEGGDPFLLELLRSFKEFTGTGILINTSFNRRGEPIVESPLDAVDACLGMGIDGIYLDGEYYYSCCTSPSM